jgi:hypothetical protein
MSGHTPGPWKIGGQSGNPGEGEEISADGRLIAWTAATYDEDEDEDVVTEEDRANAKLIAAAPDLLAALRYAVTVMQDYDIDEHLSGEFEVFTDAIAKAEGRAHA